MITYLTFLFIACASWLAFRLRKLTGPGAFAAAAVASVIYLGTGWQGILFLGLFFLLATLATSVGGKQKQSQYKPEPDTEQRTVGQVFANGGIAALCALVAILWPQHRVLCTLMLAASFSAATADTLSSELGMIYGRRFYNILSFRKDIRGENGVVSAEGTLIGIAGSALVAIVYSLTSGWGSHFWTILIAGTFGNIVDSVLGATLERRGYIGNNVVNMLNTLAGALAACLFFAL